MDLMKSGSDNIYKAVELEKAGDTVGAYDHYEKGIQILLIVLKYEKNKTAKELLSKRIASYIARAEKLKDSNEGQCESNSDNSGEGAGEHFKAFDLNDSNRVNWDDVIGMKNAKALLREATILPRRFPELFKGIRSWKAILLFGPGGTGKTMLASAVASETGATFFSVSSSDILSKWQGESEKHIKQLFDQARNSAPSVVFFDEIDSLGSTRSNQDNDSTRRIKTELLVQMQGISNDNKDLLIIGATNTPWMLDSAIRRRFEKRIYVGLPTRADREEMIKIFTEDNLPNGDEDVKRMAKYTDGYTGSDLSILCRDLLMVPMRMAQMSVQWLHENDEWKPCRENPNCEKCDKNIVKCLNCNAYWITMMEIPENSKIVLQPITTSDVDLALTISRPSITEEEVEKHIEWADEFGENI